MIALQYTRRHKNPNQTIMEKEKRKRHMGWKIVELRGDAFSRGVQHGTILSSELATLKRAFPNLVRKVYKVSFKKYTAKCAETLPLAQFTAKWPEWAAELEGMVVGARTAGVNLTAEFLLHWNMYLSMDPFYDSKRRNNRCCAFIACGEATETGEIVIAHNTHSTFEEAAISNIISYVYPDVGYAFVMQTMPGLIASSMDWFITSAGMVGCETTIGNFKEEPDFSKTPYFCRIRECMQYGGSNDDYLRIMVESNAGDYACSWLFGDIKTNEIAMLELGKNLWSVERTNSGAYVGANWVNDERLRMTETTLTHVDACYVRNTRLSELVFLRFWGKINSQNAKRILSDHYYSIEGTDTPRGYSICRHMETERDSMPGHNPYDLYGTIDGKVATSDTARKMAFWARWGSSCGRVFHATEHAKKHPEYRSKIGFVMNFSGNPWAKISVPEINLYRSGLLHACKSEAIDRL